jgi:hypothetical protein
MWPLSIGERLAGDLERVAEAFDRVSQKLGHD